MDQPCIKSTDREERMAAKWALKVKKMYWKGKLSQEKIDILNKTEGWTWCPVGYETWGMIGFGKDI